MTDTVEPQFEYDRKIDIYALASLFGYSPEEVKSICSIRIDTNSLAVTRFVGDPRDRSARLIGKNGRAVRIEEEFSWLAVGKPEVLGPTSYAGIEW